MTRTRRMLALVGTTMAVVLALSGCNAQRSAPADGPSATAGAGFPVTIKHAFGETTIDTAPKRIVTWGWGATDAVIALGQVPVAIPEATYGGDKEGVLPWVRDALDARDAQLPMLLDATTEEVPLEQVATLDADLFLAPYSGLTKEDYTKLTALGLDVVAYPSKPWSTPWRDVITTTAQAIGATDKAEEVLADIDQRVAEAAGAHPEFKGVSVAQVWDDAGTFYVYLPADPRVAFSESLGLVSAESVSKLDTGEDTFYYTLSYEKLDELTSDILVVYADTQQELDRFLASKPAQLLPQVKAGTIAGVIGPSKVASVSPPTALSLTWGMNSYVDALSKAVAAVKR